MSDLDELESMFWDTTGANDRWGMNMAASWPGWLTRIPIVDGFWVVAAHNAFVGLLQELRAARAAIEAAEEHICADFHKRDHLTKALNAYEAVVAGLRAKRGAD